MVYNYNLFLCDLNALELRLISIRIPFMKMVALPCGKQRCIHGLAINVPPNLTHFVHYYHVYHHRLN